MILLILFFSLFHLANPQPTIHQKDYSKYFDEYKVRGSFLLYDLDKKEYISYNPERCKKGFLPASTFKITNSLIGLETGVISDENFRMPWNGEKRRIAAWEQDHTLKSAFQVSCVPCYQEVARQVGEERMMAYLKKARYGKMVVKGHLDTFWLEGDSRITQFEQIDFISRLYQNRLPFSARTMQIVKSIMLAEEKPAYTLRGKTGWTSQDGLDIGWYVGYLERDGKAYIFATNVEAEKPDEELFMACRRGITEKILAELKLIEK